ncbi:MAG: M1 family aminopeptidase [Pseudomonadota bacterium]
MHASFLAFMAIACDPASDQEAPPSLAPGPQDILSTDIALDLAALTGHAEVLVQPEPGTEAIALNVAGLTLTSVTLDGAPTPWTLQGPRLVLPTTGEPLTVAVDYAFPARTYATFDGWMPGLGASFIWPSYCGNLFPCDPSPVDGVTFTMDVSGHEGTAVFPPSTWSDAPSYQPAVAVGDYTRLDLGTTAAGTTLYAWYLPDGEADSRAGTANLLATFDFFERTYGPYAFGPEAGTVEVDWGPDSYGGMEHHPVVHVAKWDLWNEETQVHEMAHGWFGDGVRLACWEDFVLSEGTVTYMAARALEAVDGPDLWPGYVQWFLTPLCEGRDVNTVVLPETCGVIDFEHSALWSLAPYMKGACFYEDVGDLIGFDVLDAAIADFYQAHVGTAGRMRDMISTIEAHAPGQADGIEALVTDWLLTEACPLDYAVRCRAHER